MLTHCINCGMELNALNMSDVDPKFCGDCADEIVEKLQNDLSETTLVLWEK